MTSDSTVLKVNGPVRGVAVWGLAPGMAEVIAEDAAKVLATIVAFVRLPLAKPSVRRQAITFIARGVVLVLQAWAGLAG